MAAVVGKFSQFEAPVVNVTIRRANLDGATTEHELRAEAEVTLPALVDTGAELTLVTSRVIRELGVSPHTMRNMDRPGSSSLHKCPICLVSLEIHGFTYILPEVEVGQVDHIFDDTECLLGRDVISLFELRAVGPAGTFSLGEMSGALSPEG